MADITSKGLRVPKNPAQALRELNRQHAQEPDSASTEREEENGNNTILQTDKQTDQLTNQPTSKPTNKQPTPSRQKARPKAPLKIAEQTQEGEQAYLLKPARVDGRSLRIRQATADLTLVTSFRLAVSTVEQLDDFCWQHRMRKQDVVQAALDLYIKAMLEEESD
jgi:hypothetical protein